MPFNCNSKPNQFVHSQASATVAKYSQPGNDASPALIVQTASMIHAELSSVTVTASLHIMTDLLDKTISHTE